MNIRNLQAPNSQPIAITIHNKWENTATAPIFSAAEFLRSEEYAFDRDGCFIDKGIIIKGLLNNISYRDILCRCMMNPFKIVYTVIQVEEGDMPDELTMVLNMLDADGNEATRTVLPKVDATKKLFSTKFSYNVDALTGLKLTGVPGNCKLTVFFYRPETDKLPESLHGGTPYVFAVKNTTDNILEDVACLVGGNQAVYLRDISIESRTNDVDHESFISQLTDTPFQGYFMTIESESAQRVSPVLYYEMWDNNSNNSKRPITFQKHDDTVYVGNIIAYRIDNHVALSINKMYPNELLLISFHPSPTE